MKTVALLALIVLIPGRAVCGDVTVSVRTSQGRPAPEAVVTIAAPHSGPIRFPWTYAVAQQNLQFDPFVLIVPVGADVAFPNKDKVRHHVYSFSPTKTFELKLYGQDQTRLVRFDKAGVVPLGCNIHDNMVAFVCVVDSPYFAKTADSGAASLNLPAGRYRLRAWHPNATGAIPPQEITVAAAPLNIPLAIDVDSTSATVAAWPE